MTDDTSDGLSRVKKLIERFEEHADAYTAGTYNETQLRREFLDPLFRALGWDVDNHQNYAEAYKDVIHEDSLKIGATTKAPDYSFRIGGTRKFFVEAKKPSVNIKDDVAPAFQLRRYAWSAKLPLSILTDFEEFAVYDTRVRPRKGDKAATARILYLRYSDYEEKWDDIRSIFSREAILKGSFDKYADSNKRKQGTTEVDDAFLQEIEGWRSHLAKNIALRNPTLDTWDLNFVVTRTIDRIIFLRICEDRGIESYGTLRECSQQKHIYKSLLNLFFKADDRYNSGLFHFSEEKTRATHPDNLSPSISIDDRTLRPILSHLYYPESPYEFSVLPADILGQVYEQFLGKVITLSPSNRARIEEKPEVRRSGGVYYTPTYVVRYIVECTLGTKLRDRSLVDVGGLTSTFKQSTSKSSDPLTVLDPACGSGSFLLGAYQYLLDWYLAQYVDDGIDKHSSGKNPRLLQDKSGRWKLAIEERKRILLTHIYGVDIDPQAVEVTKLSLLLKVLEGESHYSLTNQRDWVGKVRALPDLGDNIKCGNSLISPDIWDNMPFEQLTQEHARKVNAFDWYDEFPGVFSKGGFDCIIGNPPYLKEYTHSEPFHLLKKSQRSAYYQGKMDLWYAFTCLSIDLLKERGVHSVIATSNWITSDGARTLRAKITSETNLRKFVDFGSHQVFKDAGVNTAIFVLDKTSKLQSKTRYWRLLQSPSTISNLERYLATASNEEVAYTESPPPIKSDKPIHFGTQANRDVVERIEQESPVRLSSRDMTQGVICPQDFVSNRHKEKLPNRSVGEGIFILSSEELKALRLEPHETSLIKPFFTTAELNRYHGSRDNCYWLIYTDSKQAKNMGDFPNITAHLDQFKGVITSSNGPYGLHRARNMKFFEGESILALRKCKRPTFSYADFPCYVTQTFNVLQPSHIDLKVLTGILNSNLAWFWFDNAGSKQGDIYQIDSGPLLRFPIPEMESTDAQKEALELRKAVDRIIELLELSSSTQNSEKNKLLKRQVVQMERRANNCVYNLYGLDEFEIDIIEGFVAQ